MRKPKLRDEMRAEYDFGNGIRGKYARRYAQGTNVLLLDPDVAEMFGDSASVNSLLRGIAGLVRKSKPQLAK